MSGESPVTVAGVRSIVRILLFWLDVSDGSVIPPTTLGAPGVPMREGVPGPVFPAVHCARVELS